MKFFLCVTLVDPKNYTLNFCFFLKANKKSGNGPGKALRQENSLSSQQDSFDKHLPLSDLTTTLKSTSISSKSYNPNINPAPNLTPNNNPIAISTSSNPKGIVTVSTTLSSSNNSTSTSISSKIESNSNSNAPSYISANEDLNKMEKFKTILAANPINLEELQKASWKGIPKCFRPICWKLLSVGFIWSILLFF